MPYRHVLIPIDRGEPDRRAAEAALELATQSQARITLMYVIEAIEGEDEADLNEFYAEMEHGVRERLRCLMGPFQEAGLTVHIEVVVGHRARTIVHYTTSESVDLIVMASQRADLRQPQRALDSLSHQVSLFCQCPVMLIK